MNLDAAGGRSLAAQEDEARERDAEYDDEIEHLSDWVEQQQKRIRAIFAEDPSVREMKAELRAIVWDVLEHGASHPRVVMERRRRWHLSQQPKER